MSAYKCMHLSVLPCVQICMCDLCVCNAVLSVCCALRTYLSIHKEIHCEYVGNLFLSPFGTHISDFKFVILFESASHVIHETNLLL